MALRHPQRRDLLGAGAVLPFVFASAAAPQATVPPGYRLTFASRFSDPSAPLFRQDGGPFTTRYEQWGGLRTLPGNQEQEVYVDPRFVPGGVDALGHADARPGAAAAPLGIDPFVLRDGALDIVARPTPSARLAAVGLPYVSGMLSTEWSFTQRFGYFEMRASLPAGRGLWPAFWMVANTSAEHIEIDIFEALGHEPQIIYQSTHLRPERGRGLIKRVRMPDGDITAMHSYGLEWTEQALLFSVDGLPTLRVDGAPLRDSPPMYLIANLAVGGSWGGNPDAATEFPAVMRIEHIRAYARA